MCISLRAVYCGICFPAVVYLHAQYSILETTCHLTWPQSICVSNHWPISLHSLLLSSALQSGDFADNVMYDEELRDSQIMLRIKAATIQKLVEKCSHIMNMQVCPSIKCTHCMRFTACMRNMLRDMVCIHSCVTPVDLQIQTLSEHFWWPTDRFASPSVAHGIAHRTLHISRGGQ